MELEENRKNFRAEVVAQGGSFLHRKGRAPSRAVADPPTKYSELPVKKHVQVPIEKAVGWESGIRETG